MLHIPKEQIGQRPGLIDAPAVAGLAKAEQIDTSQGNRANHVTLDPTRNIAPIAGKYEGYA